jgi:hypothetical protein
MSTTAERIRDDEPPSYFFFEQLGERSVSQSTLIECGVDLWGQAARHYAVEELWDYAQELLESAEESLGFSKAEQLRLSVICGETVPPDWKDGASFPFKGLLVSAVYFKEAHRALSGPMPDRAWHLIATAFYHLGVNSTESPQMAQSRVRAQENGAATLEIRVLTGYALDWVIKNHSPVSKSRAKELVYDWLETFEQKHPEVFLTAADKMGIKTSLPPKQRSAEALEKALALLHTWALPQGPYPEISRKFSEASSAATKPPKAKSSRMKLEPQKPDESGSDESRPEIISVMPDGEIVRLRAASSG